MPLLSGMFTAERGTAAWGPDAGEALVSDVRNIEGNHTMEENRALTSSTDGKFDRRLAGDDWQGTFTMYVPVSAAAETIEDAMPFKPGDGDPNQNPTLGLQKLILKNDANQTLFNDYAVIISIAYATPVEAAGLVEATVTWGRIITVDTGP